MRGNYITNNHSNKNYILLYKKYNIWLVNTQGEILFKLPSIGNTDLDLDQATITSTSEEDCINKIETYWSILCTTQDLQIIKTSKLNINNHLCDLREYILEIELDGQQSIDLITKSSCGEFIPYQELEKVIKQYNKDEIFIESYTNLIKHLQKKHKLITLSA